MSAPLPERLTLDADLDLCDERGEKRVDGNYCGRSLAAEIARRWNAHAALVAALEDTLARFVGDDRETWGEAEIAVEARARAALRAAKDGDA